MLQSLIAGFAAVGGFILSLVIIAAGTAGGLMSTGVFFEQVGTTVFKLKADPCVNAGIKTGGILGFIWAIVAIWSVGYFGAILSLLGLCATLLFLAWLTWFIGDVKRPARPDFD